MFVLFDDESQAVLVHIWKHQTGMGYLTMLCNLTQIRLYQGDNGGRNVTV